VKIGCVLDDKEAEFGLKLQTDVAITTPEYLPKLLRDGDISPSKLRVVIYDEADLGLEQTPDEDLERLFQTEVDQDLSRLTYLVGASVTESLGQLCVRDSVLPMGNSFIATATKFAPILKEELTGESVADLDNDTASFQDLGMCLDPGLIHERVVVPTDSGLICLARMLRDELKTYEEDINLGRNETMKIQRPRVVVFFPGEEEAKAAIEPMRDAMWGEHKLCVLLPNIGENPLLIMEQFKSDQMSVMLATPNSVRGLDFANLTHVYTLYLPADDPREYLHLAGRVGRIGQIGSVTGKGGRVTSILQPDESDKMETLADTLKFEFVDVDYTPDKIDDTNVEDMRRFLEDTMSLVTLADEPEFDLDAMELNRPVFDDDDDGDDEENSEE
jgi:superfamily II DNA/RNA helicase